MSFMNLKQSPSKDLIRGVAIKLLFGLPVAGFIWTIIFRYVGSSELWNWKILLIFSFIGLFLGGVSLISNNCGIIVFKFWKSLIFLIDKIVTWTSLSIFYYLIFSPYSLLVQYSGKSKFCRTKNQHSSYWKNVSQKKSIKRYLQQF